MAEYIGFSDSKIISSDLQVTKDYQNGTTAKQKYVIKTSSYALPKIGSAFASLVQGGPSELNFLTLESVNTQGLDGGLTEVTLNFSGSSGQQYSFDASGDNPVVYRLDCRLIERGILEHPKYNELKDDEKLALAYLDNGTVLPDIDYTRVGNWEINETFGWLYDFVPLKNQNNEVIILEEVAIEFAKLIVSGKKTYLFPVITWTEVATGNQGLKNVQLNAIGKIVNTPRGDPPEPGTGRSWLLTNATQEQRGEKLFQTTLEWQLSDENGWDEFLYQSQ